MAPHWAHYPLVLLATVATVIASQAVISGVYSITRQAVQLGQLPRMEIRHTSATDYGQIYVPRMNALLCVGVVLIVLIFKSSDALAAAYGIAVTGVMVISTFLVAHRRHAPVGLEHSAGRSRVFGFLALDRSGLPVPPTRSRSCEGGWLPLVIAAGVFIVMETWRLGRRVHLDKIRSEFAAARPLPRARRQDAGARGGHGRVPHRARRRRAGRAAAQSEAQQGAARARRARHVQVDDTPFVPPTSGARSEKARQGLLTTCTSITASSKRRTCRKALQLARPFGLAIDVDTTTFFVGRETLVPAEHPALGQWRTWLYIRLASKALSPARFYHLPPNRVVELGTQVTI